MQDAARSTSSDPTLLRLLKITLFLRLDSSQADKVRVQGIHALFSVLLCRLWSPNANIEYILSFEDTSRNFHEAMSCES